MMDDKNKSGLEWILYLLAMGGSLLTPVTSTFTSILSGVKNVLGINTPETSPIPDTGSTWTNPPANTTQWNISKLWEGISPFDNTPWEPFGNRTVSFTIPVEGNQFVFPDERWRNWFNTVYYPNRNDPAFLQSGGGIFNNVPIKFVPEWLR